MLSSKLISAGFRGRILLLQRGTAWRGLSSKTVEKEAGDKEMDMMKVGDSIYDAKFAKRVKIVRRVSFASTFASAALLATVASGLSPSSMALFGQYAIAGAGLVMSGSCTLILHMVSSPYVIQLRPLINMTQGEDGRGDRSFSVTTLNFMGMEVTRQFALSQVSESIHPCASFKADKNHYYVFGGGLVDQDDEELKEKLTRRGEEEI